MSGMKNLLCWSAFAMVLLAGCAAENKSEGSADGAQGGGSDEISVALVSNSASDFWTIARRGMEKAATDIDGVKATMYVPSTGSTEEQQRLLDDLTAKGVDGISVSPVDPENQTTALNRVAEKTLLLTTDSDAPNSNRSAYVGTDNVAAGRQAGEVIREALPDGGKVMVFVGRKDAQNAADRINGIRAVLEGSNISIVDVRTDDTDRVRAKANVTDTIVQHADVNCLVGIWSYNGPAILNAVREANKLGQIQIVCFDEEEETLQGVQDGNIFATIVQQPYEFGYKSVELMAQYLKGNKEALPADKKLIVPTVVVKKDQAKEFSDKLKELKAQ